MNLEIVTPDPLRILTTTRPVLEQARDINLNGEGLAQLAKQVKDRLHLGLETARDGFGATGDFMKDVQLIFLQSVVNFCFWGRKDQPKWEIEGEKGESIGGGYGMIASFKRALAEGSPIFEANYLSSTDRDAVADLFRSNNNTQIPLLDRRVDSLREAGEVLRKRYNGQFVNALEEAEFDAIKIAQLLIKDFPSFRDIAQLDGKDIFFLKRAQICPNDLSYLGRSGLGKPITNLEGLTAFADYKIPQILREFGVVTYSKNLADHVDNYILVPAGSREEIEIRAATIWGVELLRQRLQKFTAGEIDNALWLISQDQTGIRPYHRTETIYY